MIAKAIENGVAYKKDGHEILITSQMLLTSRLTPKELETVKVRLGFDGNGVKTMREAAKILQCSTERVRVLENKAFVKLTSEFPFSMRAINVLKEGGYLVNNRILVEKLLMATPEKIRDEKGCGEKVFNEIMEYRNSLKR